MSLLYYILAAPMCKCLGKHSSMSSSFPIAILYGTCIFWPMGLLFFGPADSCCTFFGIFAFIHLRSASVSLSYFILALPMHKCFGKHLCMSSTFLIAILYSTYLFFSQYKMIFAYVEALPAKN